jgi:hypothetical protein
MRTSHALAAPLSEKRIGLNRYPDARLWVLNDVRP